MDIPHCWSVIPNPLQMPWVWNLQGLMGNHLYSRYFWQQNCEIKKFKMLNGSAMPGPSCKSIGVEHGGI